MSDLKKFTDEELMKAYQGGNEMAFEILYERYSGKVYGFLYGKLRDRTAVDDLFQATFMKLHLSRSRYDSSLPFAPWLFTVCRNVLVDGVRTRERSKEDPDPVALEQAVAVEKGEPESGELPNLAALASAQRKAVELRYQDQLSFVEIARRLETTPSNARQLISRAIRKLKNLADKKRSGV